MHAVHRATSPMGANTFTGNQTITGNLSDTGNILQQAYHRTNRQLSGNNSPPILSVTKAA